MIIESIMLLSTVNPQLSTLPASPTLPAVAVTLPVADVSVINSLPECDPENGKKQKVCVDFVNGKPVIRINYGKTSLKV